MIDRSFFAGPRVMVYDLEHTSWPGYMEAGFSMDGKNREIIQIGAVLLDAANGFQELAAFQVLVKTVFHPELSDYIIELTGITQQQVDQDGVPFADALARFAAFVSDGSAVTTSNGDDSKTIAENCALHGLEMPRAFHDFVDMRRLFAETLEMSESAVNSNEVPGLFGLDVVEAAHDALGDSRALAAALRHLRIKGEI